MLGSRIHSLKQMIVQDSMKQNPLLVLGTMMALFFSTPVLSVIITCFHLRCLQN